MRAVSGYVDRCQGRKRLFVVLQVVDKRWGLKRELRRSDAAAGLDQGSVGRTAEIGRWKVL